MADRGSLFCASCGTVSVLEGDCPQCTKPLKKLGRIGVITESKRATQQLINFENNKAIVGLPLTRLSRSSQLLADSDDSDSSPAPIPKPKSPKSPKSPRPHPHITPLPLYSTVITEQQKSPRQTPTTPPSPTLKSPKGSFQLQSKSEAVPSQADREAPTTDSQPTDQAPAQRSFIAAAINRVSQAFSWKSVS